MSHHVAEKNLSRHGSQRSKSRLASRKVRAILAGGLALGIGVGVTLASWNNSEYAQGTYTAGILDLEGSLATGVFSQHPVDALGTLVYSTSGINLAPTDVTYAAYAVRLSSDTTSNAAVTMLSTGTSGVVTNLTYSLVKTTSFTCNATAISAATGSDILVANKPLAFVIPNTVTFNLAMGNPTATTPLAGTAQNLCFAVTAGVGLVQGQTGTSTISFTATSTS